MKNVLVVADLQPIDQQLIDKQGTVCLAVSQIYSQWKDLQRLTTTSAQKRQRCR